MIMQNVFIAIQKKTISQVINALEMIKSLL